MKLTNKKTAIIVLILGILLLFWGMCIPLLAPSPARDKNGVVQYDQNGRLILDPESVEKVNRIRQQHTVCLVLGVIIIPFAIISIIKSKKKK
ncbi:hypothetical protein ACFL1I_06655 [Candidatus Omnitrophota bacterium]